MQVHEMDKFEMLCSRNCVYGKSKQAARRGGLLASAFGDRQPLLGLIKNFSPVARLL
jgi:hypothetical protein